MMELVIAPQCAKIGLWRCLKAGVNPEFPEQGTPQGGIVSPLLANIALNGIESIGESRKPSGKTKIDHIETIRYADDVVAICKSRSQAEELFEKIRAWLAPIGLKVKESKTRIVAATEGFDFLGWHFVVQSNGKFRSTPSEANYQAFKEKVKEIVNSSNLKTEEKSKKLAPIVRGWRNYHRHCKMKGSRFSLWYLQYDAWKRFNKDKNTNRDLTTKLIARAFPTVGYAENKFVNVKEDKSPFDGDMIYWSARQSLRYDGLTVELLKKQKHKCAECGLGFWTGDKVEVHHKDGNHGNWKRSNLVAIHNHCHHYIHMKGVGKDSKS